MQSATYSFKDTSGGFQHVLAGPFPFAGQLGVGQFTISMHTEQTVLDTASDGLIMPSALAGQSGSISIEVQQTSLIHSFLLRWYNLIKSARDNGDVTNWANAAISLISLVDGSRHVLTGVAPSKIPDKVYAAQGGKLTWVLLACNVESQTL